MSTMHRIACVALMSVGLGTPAALSAAPFEQVHGATLNFEQALKGAAPVQICPGGGYISAGFTHHQGGRIDLDVYVVRTPDPGGLPGWEKTYDLNNAQGDDVGTSIREIQVNPQGGFIVTGTTRAPGRADRDVLLLRLDCNGNLLWCQTLRTLDDLTAAPSDDEARDVIETATGAQMGDLVIAGSSRRSAAPDLDGYLVRTDPNGSVRWSRLYHETASGGNPQYSEWLNALAEAQPVQGQPLGDILAVGAQEGAYGNWRDGLAIRVSGTTGGFTAPLHTMAIHNLPTDGPLVRTTELWAVRELQTGANQLNLVMAGTNAAWLGTSEGYAVRTGPNLTNVLAERLLGDGMAGSGDEGFTDVVEIANPSGYAVPGHLAVTGFAPSGAGRDLILLALDVNTLLPIPGTGRLLGDHGPGDEWGTALAQVQANAGIGRNAGFYLNGVNQSDPGGVGDLEDMYLVKTDPLGFTPCATAWSPEGSLPEDCDCHLTPQTVNPGTFNVSCQSLPHAESWGTDVCQ
jgi:hypothetical protein